MNDPGIFMYGASILLFIFLSIQSGYLFFFALTGRLISLKKYKHTSHTGRFVIYLFCDQEDTIIETAKSVIALCYPSGKKHIVLISPTLQPATAHALREMSVQTIAFSHNNIPKTKALQLALRQTENSFDYALILSAADVCTKGFLYRMNDAFQNGFDVVQGQHIVKNTGSVFALLDAISEGIDTHIFCKSHQLLGLSSSITDSGVGIRYSLLRDVVPVLTGAGDFSKEIECCLLRKHVHFGYAPKACLYEEKKHRNNDARHKYYRWTTGKAHGLKAYLSDGVSELRNGNVDYLDKVFQSLLLPRILLLGITPLTVLVSFLGLPVLATDYWLILWLVTYTAILMSMPAKYVTNHFLQALFFLPVSFISMAKLFIKPKKKALRATYPSAV